MDQQTDDKIDKLEKRLDQLEKDLKTRFVHAAKLFDLLNNRLKTANDSFSNNELDEACNQISQRHVECLYHNGKRYFCMKHARRMACIMSDFSRPPGFDVCFERGNECKHLEVLD